MKGAAPENPVELTDEGIPTEQAVSASPLTLTVSTWNISCSPNNSGVSCEADPSWTPKDNENCIARAVIESFSDVLVLQEAPGKLDKMLSRNVWRMEHDGELLRTNSHCPYLWVLVKKRLDCDIVRVNRMDGAVLVHMRFSDGRTVVVAGVHFMAGAEAFEMRKLQMQKVLEAYESSDASLIVAGDMNVRQREVTTLLRYSKANLVELPLPRGVFTWNGFKNKYHGPDSFAFRCNFDRIFVSNDMEQEDGVGRTTLIGDKPIIHGNSKFFLSDHFGIRATIRLA